MIPPADSPAPSEPALHSTDDSIRIESFESEATEISLIDRRKFLAQGARGLAGALLAFQSLRWTESLAAQGAPAAFTYGVASGDPLPTRVIIWTRVNPSPQATPGSGLGSPVLGTWEVARDASFTQRVATGRFTSSADRDHTIKIDVAGLSPSTEYYYRFYALGVYSQVGRTRTAPAELEVVTSLRFGLLSCSNYEAGFFSAYRHLAARNDLNFILHIGDYIYEYATGVYADPAVLSAGRTHNPPGEIVSLQDYRLRHALHKSDPDSNTLHARYAFITTWDDHEVANDCWNGGAQNHNPLTQGDFFVRRAFAYQAYLEWMPIRLPDALAPTRIYRSFRFGNLLDLFMLDLRQYRDKQAANGTIPSTDPSETPGTRAVDEHNRKFTGAEEMGWFKTNLTQSNATWRVVGNSVQIAPVDFSAPGFPPAVLAQIGAMAGVPSNVDSWDGYRNERKLILDHIAGNPNGTGAPTTAVINNVVFLTGDIHSTWACDVPRDVVGYALGTSPSVAAELVGTSVTSDNLNEILGLPPRSATSLGYENIVKGANRHIKLLELDSHGFSVVEVTPQRTQMDWYYLSNRADPQATASYSTSMQVLVGTNRVQTSGAPIPRPAPENPRSASPRNA